MDAQWFVIANKKKINIYVETKKRNKLELLQTFENPIAEEASAIPFAKQVVSFLDKAHTLKRFKTLTVAAEPHFLGKFREVMKPQLESLVKNWLKKDLLKIPKAELPSHLPLNAVEATA